MESAAANQRQQSFPDSVAFRRTWRAYQARVLDHLTAYLSDNRIHLVAAPGSGKTVIGLELIRRIDRPTLVLTPTTTIRDQWVDRLTDHFLPEGDSPPSWVSTDIRKPALLTVATYQALHAVCANDSDKPAAAESAADVAPAEPSEPEVYGNEHETAHQFCFPDVLAHAQFGTLVVDEAHHLRSEWWRTLTFVFEQLDQPRIVALTATPPYDVSPFEWQRYQELCGPVDTEVSVPELVREGDLCPHQDYVYFSIPTTEEFLKIGHFRAKVDAFVQRLRANAGFREAILAHPWVAASNDYVEEILDDPEYFSSMIIYLHGVGVIVPPEALQLLGLDNKQIPALALEWLEILLSHCLYADDERFHNDDVLRPIRHELLDTGAIERRKVKLRSPSDHLRLLTTSVTKLKSVEEIVKLEADSLGGQLRCVVLTDFIRKSDLPRSPGEVPVFEDIGVVPIFETLRNAALPNTRLGVLSGSLVIVPGVSEKLLREIADGLGIEADDLVLTPLVCDDAYSALEVRGQYSRGTVRLITELFHRGAITVLVGTKSLLGEGWDAPCINTLILASFVGSYVLSNQMRGRSIRTDPGVPNKTANIWHLVCVEPGLLGPGEDFELLVRRCSAFMGVGAKDLTIENGTERLGFGHPPFTRDQIRVMNQETAGRARDRGSLRLRWRDALGAGRIQQTVDGLKVPDPSLPRGFVFSNTIRALLTQAAFIFLIVFYYLGRGGAQVARGMDPLLFIVLVVGIAAAASLPWALLALWRFIRHGTPEGSIRQIGAAVLEGLKYEGSAEKSSGEFRVYADRNEDGTVFCWIGGGTGKEQAVFLRALREILSPIGNPRYFLARRRWLKFFREDYFNIPEILARKKEFAEVFARAWKRLVGPAELVYARTPEGRRLLLHARSHSLSGAFQQRSERVSCWK